MLSDLLEKFAERQTIREACRLQLDHPQVTPRIVELVFHVNYCVAVRRSVVNYPVHRNARNHATTATGSLFLLPRECTREEERGVSE